MTDAVRCKKDAWPMGRCIRKAVRDGYCGQHHSEAVAALREADARFAAEEKRLRDVWERPIRNAVAARDAAWREAVERVRMLHSASCLRWIRNDESQPCSCDDTTKNHNAALDALLAAMEAK